MFTFTFAVAAVTFNFAFEEFSRMSWNGFRDVVEYPM